MDKFQSAVAEIPEIVSKFKEIIAVFVYGSVSRGDYSLRHSDIDVYIVIDKRKVPEGLKEKINLQLDKLCSKHSVKLHPEYQGIDVKKEDQSLARKIVEEGKLVYSSGSFVFNNSMLGLKPFYFYSYTVKDKNMQVRLSQTLHGRKSWYYKKGKKQIKEYKGLIDGVDIIEAGRGALIISKERLGIIESLSKTYSAEFKLKRIFFGWFLYEKHL